MTTTPIKLSDGLVEALATSLSIADLRHLVTLLEERRHIPDDRAARIAEKLAAILDSAPLDTPNGPVRNRPTVGFYRRNWPERGSR